MKPRQLQRLNDVFSRPWAQYLAIAILIFVIPSILGHPLVAGDNLIQFNPLRVLAARIERQGYLPLWNQYIWSGSPLLAGFNAGVFLPTSWLYILFPSTLAWGISQGLPYFMAAYGFYLLMRELGVSDFSSRLTGLTYAFAGVMIGQGVHLDMITGISLAPWMILCVSRMLDDGPHSRLRYAIYLAICYALVVLAGAPEAMLDELIMLAIYAVARLLQSRRDFLRKVLSLAAAGLLALGLSAAQWVPGLAFQRISQRANPTFGFVSFGAFAPQYFYSLFAPYLFGGPGALPARGYFGPFTWEEVTIYPTIGAIISLFSTITRFIKRTLESELLPYFALAIGGAALALGSYTPLESLLYHVPLYGKQRLVGRNVLTLNVAIFAFFGVWLDRLIAGRESSRWNRALLFLPAAVITGLYLIFFVSSPTLTSLLHARTRPKDVTDLAEGIVFAIALIVALINGWVYLRASKNPRRKTKAWITVALVADLAAFNVFGGLGTAVHLSQFNSTTKEMTYLHSLLGNKARFAIYDPKLITYGQLNGFGEPDLNIAAGNLSIQGYSSLSLGAYENATHTHAQATFPPSLLANPLINTLGTKEILTNWHYLTSSYGAPKAVKLPSFYLTSASKSPAELQYGSSAVNRSPVRTTGLFGRTLAARGVDINPGQAFPINTIQRVGLLEIDGTIVWLSQQSSPGKETVPSGTTFYGLADSTDQTPVPAFGIVVSQFLPSTLSDPQNALVVGAGIYSTKGYFALNGPLSSYLTYPHYHQLTTSGNVTIFQNSQARAILQPSSGAQILSNKTNLNGSLQITVRATEASAISWAEAYAPGWKLKYVSATTGKAFEASASRDGPIQTINIPKGIWKITAYYQPSSASLGIRISIATVAVTLMLLWALLASNKRKHNRSSTRT